MSDRYLTIDEAAAKAGVSRSTVMRWRRGEDGLPVHRRGHGKRGHVLISERELEAFLKPEKVT